MARLARVEVWTAVECAGGVRLAMLPVIAAARETMVHQDIGTLVLRVPLETTGSDQLRERRVVRTVQTDGTYQEWVITGLRDAHTTDGLQTEVTASEPAILLATACVVTRTEADGTVIPDFEVLGLTPTQHLSGFLVPNLAAANVPWVTIGTISSTARVDLTYGWDGPLAVIKRLAELTGTEWQFRRVGTTGYAIDLMARVGSASVTLDARLGRNLRGIKRTRSVTEQVTRCYPRGVDLGDGIRASMARNRWRVTNITGTTLTLADPAGNEGPLLVDDQLNGYYLRLAPAGTPTAITDCTAATQAVVVASAAGLAEDDLVEVCRTSTGGDLLYLDDPATIALYGVLAGVVDRPDLTDTVNLLPNPLTRAL
jgi:hypothetical protein